MFFDIGALELVVLIILGVLIFGPEKLPKVIQDTASFIRKVRSFSDNARNDIRSELGPEFKDFEFEDLNPKTFARKHLLDNEDLDLKELQNSFDLRKELSEVTDAVNGTETAADSGAGSVNGAARTSLSKDNGTASAAGDRLTKKRDPLLKDGRPSLSKEDPPPFDADAT